ncbi:hypothetical protein MKW94_016789 [Papaver nudicaule]|uniref:Uncharacterized protein n=1 Tax=Papaver nudicaule TaxID=74823 RepID=A0AA41S039_PAPNU|nr:hypothetical protein [Papaver nudicaule]MCL7051144.1 hypothetical protein [Papaver nudicaule]
MKTVFAALLFVAVLWNFSFIQTTMADGLKYCGICCQECNCVPSWTFGHKDECPCYRDKKNSKGEFKCP